MIEWEGGSMPVPHDALVNVKMRNSGVFCGFAGQFNWERHKNPKDENADIVGYELAKDPIKNASSRQVGGNHYKDCSIQPAEYSERNKLSFLEGCVVKRITRHRKEGGKGKQDLEKAIHEIQLLIELHYDKADSDQ